MLGPHFYYDLIRLARKPRNYYLRCAYLVALLFGWWYVYEASQPLGVSINDHARLARNFTFALLAFQNAMILLLAPIYLAGTIVEERESRTLELLYQTHLTDREILLGKYAARVVHLMFFALMSLPMLAIISLWGGIDVEFLLGNLVLSFVLILVLGSLCLWVSVTARRYTEAMMLAYTLEFAVGYMSIGPVMAIVGEAGGGNFVLVQWNWVVLVVAVPMLLCAAFFYYFALRGFRRLRNMEWMKRTETPPRRLPRPKPKAKKTSKPKRRRPRESDARTIPDQSLLWKETDYTQHVIDFPNRVVWLSLAAVVLMGGLFLILRLTNHIEPVGMLALGLTVFIYISALMIVYLSLALQATSAIAHERERNTLDFLLLLPVERAQILLIKWIAPWIRQRTVLFATFAIPLIGMVTTMFPPRSALLLLLLPWPPLLLINTLGLYLSVVCKRTVTANILLVAILVGVLVLHLLAWDAFLLLMRGYIDLLVEDPHSRLEEAMRHSAHLLVLGHQVLMLAFAGLFAYLAFRRFNVKMAG